MGKYADEMDKLNDKKKGKPADKPKKCMYVNCPMGATTIVGGNYRCSFHESGDFHGEVTMAIIANKTFIQAYGKMVHWKSDEWREPNNREWLLNNKNCPMEEHDLPSLYLIKFSNWLSEKIKSDAARHIERKVGHAI